MTLLEFDLADGTGPRTAQWRLDRVELINWGTFDGRYRIDVERIEVRGLPEHEDRFRLLLREKSHELMGHLLSDLREAPRLVTHRIDPANASLGRSRFDRDRHLRIRVKTQRGVFGTSLPVLPTHGLLAPNELIALRRLHSA